jgi:hypothetical protein
MKTYYLKSGSFANAIIVRAFRHKTERDKVVYCAPDNSMMHSHFDHSPEAITAKEARSIMARNRQRARDHQHNSGYDDNFGTTEISEIE